MVHELQEWWDPVRLRTVLTDPPRHELILSTGQIVRLETQDFFSVMRFSVRFLDASGSFPPLPDKGGAKFLRILTTRLFASREVVEASEEAGERGVLLSDIRSFILAAPEGDEGLDLERGAIVRRPEGALFIARHLFDRVARSCPFKVKTSEFYAAISDLGCTNQEVVRIPPWRGRCWMAPTDLLRELPEMTNGAGKAGTPSRDQAALPMSFPL